MTDKQDNLLLFDAIKEMEGKEQDIFVEEQMELSEVAASFSSGSSLSSGSCPGSTVATLSSASSVG